MIQNFREFLNEKQDNITHELANKSDLDSLQKIQTKSVLDATKNGKKQIIQSMNIIEKDKELKRLNDVFHEYIDAQRNLAYHFAVYYVLNNLQNIDIQTLADITKKSTAYNHIGDKRFKEYVGMILRDFGATFKD